MTKLGEVLIGVDKLIASESYPRGDERWLASDGKWYGYLEGMRNPDEADDGDYGNGEYEYTGPHDTEEEVDRAISNLGPNSGGYGLDDSGRQPPADVSRGRTIDQRYYDFYRQKAYPTPKFQVDNNGINQGAGGQKWRDERKEKEKEMGVQMFGSLSSHSDSWLEKYPEDKRHTYDTKYGKIQYKTPQSQAKAEQDAATLASRVSTPSKTKTSKTTPSYVKPYDTPTKKTKKTKRRKRKRKKKLTPEEQTARDTKYSERARKAWKSRKRASSGVESLLHGMDNLIEESYAKEVSVTWSENLTPLLMKWYVDHGHAKPSKQEQYAYFLGLSNHYKNEVSRINGRLVMNMWDQQNEIDFMVQFEDKNSAQRWMSKISTPHASKVKLSERHSGNVHKKKKRNQADQNRRDKRWDASRFCKSCGNYKEEDGKCDICGAETSA